MSHFDSELVVDGLGRPVLTVDSRLGRESSAVVVAEQRARSCAMVKEVQWFDLSVGI